jgi:ribosomal protein L11 methylase PrmA
MKNIRQHLTKSGVFIGSGVLASDENKLKLSAASAGFTLKRGMIRDNWMCFSIKNQ